MAAELFSVPVTPLSEVARPSTQGLFIFADSENNKILTSIENDGTIKIYTNGSGTATLSQVLGHGNKTGEQPILSDNDFASLNVFNAEASLNFNDTSRNGKLKINASELIIDYSNGTNYGALKIDIAQTTIQHTDKISLDAPFYNFTNLTINSALGIDGSGNLYTFTLPSDNQTLAEVLAVNNKTNQQSILSNNSFSKIDLFDATTTISFNNTINSGQLFIDASQTLLNFTAGVVTASVNLTQASSAISHSALVEISVVNDLIKQEGNSITIESTDALTYDAFLKTNFTETSLLWSDLSIEARINLNVTETYLFHALQINFDSPIYKYSQLTATRVPYIDASKNMVVSLVTPTELNYLSGSTSNIQLQIDTINLNVVPNTRYININGSSQDLSGNRVYTITTTGTANRISVAGGATTTPTIDISASYVGQASIVFLGTITTGVWNATAIADNYIVSALTGKTYNGLTITTTTGTLTLANSKTFSVNNTLTLSGTDASTLDIGTGGTLGSNAFTSTAFAPLASPTFTGVVTIPSNAVLGTPTSITLTNATGLPISTGVSGLGTNVATFLATPSVTNLNAALTGGPVLYKQGSLLFTHTALSPADATNYFFGGANIAAGTATANARRNVAALTGFVYSVSVFISVAGTLGTTETATIKLNNKTAATSTTISSSLKYDASGQGYGITLGTPFAVTLGDSLEIEVDMPTFTTNPTSVIHAVTINYAN